MLKLIAYKEGVWVMQFFVFASYPIYDQATRRYRGCLIGTFESASVMDAYYDLRDRIINDFGPEIIEDSLAASAAGVICLKNGVVLHINGLPLQPLTYWLESACQYRAA